MLTQILSDALFAAIAAIGFAAISRPPRRAYVWCALIAAAGHSARFALMQPQVAMHIVPATLIAAFLIGLLALLAATAAKIPAETCLFPSLLPMVPGIYAYRAFAGMAMCMLSDGQSAFDRCFYLFSYNAMMAGCIILCMTVGATLPIFMFKKIAFRATR